MADPAEPQAPVTQAEKPHQCFSAMPTAYLRSLDRDQTEAWAVHYQKPPVRNDNGSTSFSLNFPTLIVTSYIADQEDVAQCVARILNDHWDAPEEASASSAGGDVVERAGWKLVPVEPTEAMLRAGCNNIDWCRDVPVDGGHMPMSTGGAAGIKLDAKALVNGQPVGTSLGEDMTDAYRAMLAAAPAASPTPFDAIQSGEGLREALSNLIETADYLIGRYVRLWQGKGPVRDLLEAEGAYSQAKGLVALASDPQS